MFRNRILPMIKSVAWVYGIAQFVYMVVSVIGNKSIRTLTYSPPGHFYSPLPDLKQVRDRLEIPVGDVNELPGIDLKPRDQLALLGNFATYYPDIPFPQNETAGTRYYFDNPYFGEGDGIVLYSFLRHFKPEQVIEIGSGFSSALILDVNETILQPPAKLTFIEPHSERLRGLLTAKDHDNHTLLEKPVQQVGMDTFESLNENDILFIDSSHIVKFGSDVEHIVSTILPALKPGVIIHFHDILWPFEYPKEWVMQGISWNEAYFLRAFLEFNDTFEILYFNSFIASCFTEEFEKSFSSSVKNTGGEYLVTKIALRPQRSKVLSERPFRLSFDSHIF